MTLNLFGEKNPPMPVENCCKFLCKFAKINQENQRALFKHISYLLEHAEKHPGKYLGMIACKFYLLSNYFVCECTFVDIVIFYHEAHNNDMVGKYYAISLINILA